MVITDLAVFKYIEGQLTLVEVMPGATLEEVKQKTEAHFIENLS
jgi:3-oxoacid CoA-transferase